VSARCRFPVGLRCARECGSCRNARLACHRVVRGRSSGNIIGRALQPPPLRFRGRHRLKVQRAPEPHELLWENLEVRCRRGPSLTAATPSVGVIPALPSVRADEWRRALRPRDPHFHRHARCDAGKHRHHVQHDASIWGEVSRPPRFTRCRPSRLTR
jgi:hypothetical protein